jgi:hypothetical protein
MIDHSEMIYQQSLAIPQGIRQDVADVMKRNATAIHWPMLDISYLFEVWNRYMTREPEDIKCAGCRSKVIGKMRRIVAIWESRGETV